MIYRNYYYFIATLPTINYGDRPPKSSVEFRDECFSLLNPKDAALISYCCFNPKLAVETVNSTGSEFIDHLLERERALVLNLAYLRAAKLNRHDVVIDPPQDMPRTVAVAKAAFEMDDPLQATLYIDRSRWGALDTMVGIDDIFGVNNIFIHFLKLQLLERKQWFEAAKGLEIFRERYDEILDEYHSNA